MNLRHYVLGMYVPSKHGCLEGSLLVTTELSAQMRKRNAETSFLFAACPGRRSEIEMRQQ